MPHEAKVINWNSSPHFSPLVRTYQKKKKGVSCYIDISFLQIGLYKNSSNPVSKSVMCHLCVKNTCLLITHASHMQLHSKQNSILKTIKNPTHSINEEHLNIDSEGPFIEFIKNLCS